MVKVLLSTLFERVGCFRVLEPKTREYSGTGDMAQERAQNCPQKICMQSGSAAFCAFLGHADGKVTRDNERKKWTRFREMESISPG